MKCPFCKHKEDKVIDSRMKADGSSIRRRRECFKCHRRFTTYEYTEKESLFVVKKDGRREQLDRRKIISGIIKACEKRPISLEKMEETTDKVEHQIYKDFDREINSRDIGEFVMEELAKLDDVAYVRFSSVYRQFKDVNQFMKELKGMLGKHKA